MNDEDVLNRKHDWESTQKRRRRSRQQLISMATALISIILVGVTFYSSTSSRRLADRTKAEIDLVQQESISERSRLMSSQVKQLEDMVSVQRNELSSLKLNLGATEPQTAVVKSALSRLDSLENRLSILEQQNDSLSKVLGDDPFRKMSLVILTRDVAELKQNDAKDLASLTERYKADVAAVRDENKSQFDFIKWAVLFAGVSNLVGPGLGFFQRGKAPTS